MGWQDPDHGLEHEGFLRAVIKVGGQWRELGYGDPWLPELEPGAKLEVLIVQAACECGWRSPRLSAPPGTRWRPFLVITDEDFEERCRALWAEHLEAERRRHER